MSDAIPTVAVAPVAPAVKAPKVPNEVAPLLGDLPVLLTGCEWDTVEVCNIDFRIMVASDVTGISSLCKQNGSIGARIFNRALRILAPAKLDARKMLDDAAPADKLDVAGKVQRLILDLDLTTIKERASRETPTVKVDPKQKTFTNAEVVKMLQDAKVKVVTA